MNIRMHEYSHGCRVENIPRNELCVTPLFEIRSEYVIRNSDCFRIRLNSLPRRSKYKPPADNKGAQDSPSAREQIVMQTEKVDPRGDDSSTPKD